MGLRPTGGLALAWAVAGCSGGEPTPAPNTVPSTAAPFDCATFEARVYECQEAFSLAYGKTMLADLVLGGTPEEKAQSIRTALEMQKTLKQSPCKAPAWGDLSKRDPAWHARYDACDPTAPCDVWGACVGTALGTPMVYGG